MIEDWIKRYFSEEQISEVMDVLSETFEFYHITPPDSGGSRNPLSSITSWITVFTGMTYSVEIQRFRRPYNYTMRESYYRILTLDDQKILSARFIRGSNLLSYKAGTISVCIYFCFVSLLNAILKPKLSETFFPSTVA